MLTNKELEQEIPIFFVFNENFMVAF